VTTNRYEAAFRIEEGEALRWRRVAAIALASALVWTALLGLMFAPRWPELPSFAATARNQLPLAPLATSIERAENPQSEAAPAAGTGATESQPVRPKAYSSIDTQTLAAARAQGEILAGKRPPVVDSVPSTTGSANDATVVAPVAAVGNAPPVSELIDRPHSSSSRFGTTQPASALDPGRAQPERVASETRDSRLEYSQRSNHTAAALPRVASPIRASPPPPSTSRSVLAQTLPDGRGTRTPAPRVELAQTSPSGREARGVGSIPRAEGWQGDSPSPFVPPHVVRLTPDNEANGSQRPIPPRSDPPQVARRAPANGADWPVDRDTAVTSARAAPSSPQQDAVAARLDEVWERRERWLRERLHTR